MQQRSFGSVEYEHKKVKTRRQRFLERMDGLVPWAELEQRIAPIRISRNCISCSRSMLSKYWRMSTSTIQLTLRRSTA